MRTSWFFSASVREIRGVDCVGALTSCWRGLPRSDSCRIVSVLAGARNIHAEFSTRAASDGPVPMYESRACAGCLFLDPESTLNRDSRTALHHTVCVWVYCACTRCTLSTHTCAFSALGKRGEAKGVCICSALLGDPRQTLTRGSYPGLASLARPPSPGRRQTTLLMRKHSCLSPVAGKR